MISKEQLQVGKTYYRNEGPSNLAQGTIIIKSKTEEGRYVYQSSKSPFLQEESEDYLLKTLFLTRLEMLKVIRDIRKEHLERDQIILEHIETEIKNLE